MDLLGKYRIQRLLGEGATSKVFLAHDPFGNRDVAIKIVARGAAEGEGGKSERFQKKFFIAEASLAGKLTHPHIVQIYDAVADADPAYLVMEYVRGGTLEPHTRPDRLLPIGDVLEMIFKCTRALDFAWRLGVIHRDLKPANIMRVEEPRNDGHHQPGTNVKVSDFGAAMSISASETQVSGVGSPAYMSPQQIKEHPLNHQTDIFSLGVVMYQLLTGQLPFQGSNNYSMMYQITHAEPVPPSALRPELPPALDAIVMRALQKSLDDRYPTWDAFSFDLAEAFRGESLREQDNRIADSEKFNSLRRLAFFRDFTDVELWEVVRLGEWHRVAGGQMLLREGDAADGFFILAEGEVKVTKARKLLNVLSAGECVGEMAWLTPEHGTRGADVSTLCESVVIHLANAALERASEPCRHRFDRAFLRILVERLALANQRLTNV
ncbi:serine/threonine-protein kinase [Methyloversatilis sp. XJ19-13]|jgi:serine/threonine protein kinase|uniref:serine/threonine-protein kinase n=1 Tax=unclassified Methyloversatilis TaxID=2639971 RepID=UPI001A5654CE|nr:MULTISPECIES: serine/threonine-protein kinase [unclassified Methyloversatilis]MBL8475626.1 protein kinase [Methyloversatilis sp.]MCQ9374698.1 serine/threonine-protein kinase [Methyloversatilis sp. XJ19-13]